MKIPEEYIDKVHNASNNIAIFDTNTYVFIGDAKEYIERAQKDAYNQALEDAVKNAKAGINRIYDGMTYYTDKAYVDKDSILKLKKP